MIGKDKVKEVAGSKIIKDYLKMSGGDFEPISNSLMLSQVGCLKCRSNVGQPMVRRSAYGM